MSGRVPIDGPSHPLSVWIGLATVELVFTGLGLSICLVKRQTERQKGAIRKIEHLGGSVEMLPRGPEWLRDRFGNEGLRLFDDVSEVYLDGTQASDATLDHLDSLTNLQCLLLADTRISDAGLVHLEGIDRPSPAPAHEYTGERSRDGASERADQPESALPHQYERERRGVVTSARFDKPENALAFRH